MGTIIVDLLRIKGDHTLPQRNIANLIVNHMIETVIIAQPHSIHGILSILSPYEGAENSGLEMLPLNEIRINHLLDHGILIVIHLLVTHHPHTIQVIPHPLHPPDLVAMRHTSRRHHVSLKINLNHVPGRGHPQDQHYGRTEQVLLTGARDIWIHLVDVILAQCHLDLQDRELLVVADVEMVATSTDGHPLPHRTDVKALIDAGRTNTETHNRFENNQVMRVSVQSRRKNILVHRQQIQRRALDK